MPAVGTSGGDPGKVSTTGDTMTGALVLAADPTTNLQAATKHYVDTAISSAHAGAPFAPCIVIAADASGPPDGTPDGTVVIQLAPSP